uniref:Uncharacterized protein n=1 Tax=Acrobeloides nanus TaxID=290746 RepID=A0A914DCL8_9BILA
AQELFKITNDSDKKKYLKKRFQNRWIAEFEGIIRPNPTNENKFFCVVCNYEYSITTMGRAAVLTHLSTMTHQQSMKEYRERNQNLPNLLAALPQFHFQNSLSPKPSTTQASTSNIMLQTPAFDMQIDAPNDKDEGAKLKNHIDKLNQQIGTLNSEKVDLQRKALHFEAMYHREVAKSAILEGELVGYKNACQKLQEALDKSLGLSMNH